jgi:hypothetical protein
MTNSGLCLFWERTFKAQSWRNADQITGLLAPVQFRTIFQSAIKNWKIEIYETVDLSTVLYGYKTWSLTLENLFEQGKRKLQDEEIRNGHYPIILERLNQGGRDDKGT